MAAEHAPKKADRRTFDNWARNATEGVYAAPNSAELDLLWQIYQGSGSMSQQAANANLHLWRSYGTGQAREHASRQSLTHFGENISKKFKGKDNAAADGAATQQQKGASEAPAKNDTKTSTSQIGSSNPGLAAAMAAAGQGGTVTNLFSSEGLDPSTQVYGMTQAPGTKPRRAGMEGAGAFSPAQFATRTASDWLRGVYKMSPADLNNLKQRMAEGGWYGPNFDVNKLLNGRPDPDTLTAYSAVLTEAARYQAANPENKLPLDSVLQMGAPAGYGAKNGQTAPTDTMTPDIELSDALRQAAESRLGRRLAPEEEQAYLAQFRAAEKAAYQAQVATVQGGGGQYVDKPSAASFADQFITDRYGTEEASFGALSRMLEFQQMLGQATSPGSSPIRAGNQG